MIKNTYERDFTAWADEQALLLEQQRWQELDLVNLIEEVKDLGDRHRDALESHDSRIPLLGQHSLAEGLSPGVSPGVHKPRPVGDAGSDRLPSARGRLSVD